LIYPLLHSRQIAGHVIYCGLPHHLNRFSRFLNRRLVSNELNPDLPVSVSFFLKHLVNRSASRSLSSSWVLEGFSRVIFSLLHLPIAGSGVSRSVPRAKFLMVALRSYFFGSIVLSRIPFSFFIPESPYLTAWRRGGPLTYFFSLFPGRCEEF